MKPSKFLIPAAFAASLALASTASAQIWLGGQLGNPAHQGFVTTNGSTLAIDAGGNDIWNTSDNGYFYYTWAQGNWDARVRVDDMVLSSAFGGSAWAKTELMVRWSDPAVGVQGNDPFIAMMVAPGQGNGLGGQYRAARGVGAADGGGNVYTADSFPCWLRMTRTNSVFTIYSSVDGGANWTQHLQIDTAATTVGGFGAAWPNLVTVGIAVTAHSDANAAADYVTATTSFPTISSSGPGWTPPTAAGFTRNVANAAAKENCEASFSFIATNNAAPVKFPMVYQWYRNGNPVAGLTGTAVTFLATTADNGAQFQCVSWPVGYPSITTTSAVGTLTVTTDTVLANGIAKMEVFAGANRGQALIGSTGPGDTGVDGVAGKLRWVESWEDPATDPLYGNDTTRRLSGFVIPPATGAYTFYVASDDDTDVFLSPDADPSKKTLICQEPGWSGYNNWLNDGADPDDPNAVAQKCSNTWTNGLGVAPNPTGIQLTAGTRYYLEMVVHNGGGGDNGSLTAVPYGYAITNGEPTTLTGSIIQAATWQPTTFTFTTPPQNVVADEGQPATFRAVATSDGEFAAHYQWLRNGTNIPGANRSTYSVNPAVLSDSGSTFQVIASVPLMNNITSAVVSLTVRQSLFEPGFMSNQRWNGQNRAGVENGTYGEPQWANALPGMAAALNNEGGSEYTRKISGFFVPPATDRYFFYTTSDDQNDLFISTGTDPANKFMIAQETAWSNPLQWVSSGGGSPVAQKSSETFAPPAGVAVLPGYSGTTPYAMGIQLTAGQRYYMEVVQNEGGGGDNVAVTYRRQAEAYPRDGDQPRMVGNVVGFNAPKCDNVWFTLQPTNPPPILAGPNTATFYAFGGSDSQIAVGGFNPPNGNELQMTNQFVFFQWTKNGVDIPGATATSYTTPWLLPSDNGAQIACKMRALGYGTPPNTRLWSNSEPATLTVTTDTTVPTITGAGYYTGTENGLPVAYVTVTFSILMDTNTLANPLNYSIPGLTVNSVEVNRYDGRRVRLAVTGTPTFPVNVTVTGVRSWSGISAVATPVALNQTTLVLEDLGLDSGDPNYYPDPMYPAKMWLDGPKAYTLAAQGSDIWNQADGFSFLYEQKAGDFDMVLRQTAYSLPNRWAKVGLMMRESVDTITDGAGSRNWNIVNDPPDVPTLSDGNGANAVECNWRPIGAGSAQSTNINPRLGHDSTGWGNGTTFRPQYPNAWVRLKRQGQVVSAYGGTDGMNWTELARMDCTSNPNTPPLPASMYIGICITAHHNDAYGIPYEQQQFWNYASVDNYNTAYVAPPPSQTLTAALSGQNVIVSWTPTGGTLYSSPDPTLPIAQWTVVGAANPATIPLSGGQQMFFRVVTPFNP